MDNNNQFQPNVPPPQDQNQNQSQNIYPAQTITSVPAPMEEPGMPMSEPTIPELDKSEKALKVKRIIFIACFFVLLIGGITAALYFTNSGIFSAKRISTGNHSFIIDEDVWEVAEIAESNNTISLMSKNDDVMISIADEPSLSAYKYDDKTIAQGMGIPNPAKGTKKIYDNVECMVYDLENTHQGVTIKMKGLICNVNNDYNALIGIASIDSSMLEKYLNESIEIVKTGKK